MTGQTLSLAALRAFARIVETGSVTRAARSLNISQSAVSHHLKAVEAQASAPLFIRSGQRLIPTETGRLFYIDVREALRILTEAETRLHPGGEARLVLGVQYSIGFHALAPVWTQIADACPGLRIDLDLLADEPAPGQRHIDLCLSTWPLDPDFLTKAEFETHWRPYAAPGSAVSGWQESGPSLISFENGTDWRSWGMANEQIAGRTLHTNSAGLAQMLAAQGAGIALCADILANAAVRSGQLAALSDRAIALEWGQIRLAVNARSAQRAEIGPLVERLTSILSPD